MKIFLSGSSHNDIPKCYRDVATKVVSLFDKDNTVIIGGIPGSYPSDSMMGIYDSYFNKHKYITVEKYDSDNKPKSARVFYYSFDRTKEIYKEANVIVLLPGGIGTLAEVTSIIEEARTNVSKKKIFLFNYMNYYDSVIEFINKAISENFASKSDIDNIVIVNNFKELEKEMERL